MLTRVRIRNFKQFDDVSVELGDPVVFIGPNNSGKTTALQALALWELGVRRWNEKRGPEPTGKRRSKKPEKRIGVVINRRDLLATPVPDSKLLWKDVHVRNVARSNGKSATANVRIEIEVEGLRLTESWSCGLEFDYQNEESIYVRPLKSGADDSRSGVPKDELVPRVAFLPAMSGLAANETRLDRGAIGVRIGEGRTAEVLRNLCYSVHSEQPERWGRLSELMLNLFGCRLQSPRYIPQRGEIEMSYLDARGTELDLSCTGRGFQQTLLLMAYMASNPHSVLLLDEPDAHLEVLRQRAIYQLLTQEAQLAGCQIVAASHSEVILNEAADRDVVVAFVGAPHRIDDRGKEVVKALKEIGFDQYLLAEQRGWVLYLEGATDLAILKAFARTLNHPAQSDLASVFCKPIGNQPNQARFHFHGLREAKPDLQGLIVCDRLDRGPDPQPALDEHHWSRREIENYLCQPETLESWAAARVRALEASPGPLFDAPEVQRFVNLMRQCYQELIPPRALQDRADPWWRNTKASDEFLDRVFSEFGNQLGLPGGYFRKSDYHQLAEFVPRDQIDPEIEQVLDKIHAAALRAKPVDGYEAAAQEVP